MTSKKLKVESWPIEKLIPYARNPRKNDHAVERVAAAIREFGFRVPLVAKSDGSLVDGHLRLKAAQKLGLKEVPVVLADDMTEAQIKAFRISVNRMAELAEWDNELLALEFAELKELGFDTSLTGFDNDMLAEIMPPEKSEPLTDEDAVPEVEDAPVVKRGDTWILGNHRLRCGDSTSAEDVALLMNGEKADMVFTDPPYNIDFKPQRGTHQTILNDNMSPSVFKEWLKKVVVQLDNNLQKDSYLFVWCGWSTIDQFAPVLREFFTIKAMPIWIKNNFGIGYYSRPKYEPFFLCLKGEPKRPETAPADVWEFAKVVKTIHSCEKPVGLIMEILNTYQKIGSVLDLFGGSGSTLIACEKTGRKCFMMELDEKYVQVIIRRWQEYTGKDAYHAETGEVFNSLAAK